MHVVARFSALFIAFCAVQAPALAVEPFAPERLITAEEAVLISIRSSLNKVTLPSRPTQREKGDAIDRNGLAKFYVALGDDPDPLKRRPLWVTETGLGSQAQRAIEEIANAAEWGLPADAFDVPDNVQISGQPLNARELVELEMQMSLAILKYARYARGGRMDPTDLTLDIDRKTPLLAAETVLRGAHEAEDIAAFLRGLHPKHEQFVKLRQAYLQALDQEADGEGERKSRGTKLSQRLLYNMEMWRWMPEDLGDLYVMPNVPEFRIRVVKNNQVIHSERIVTGKVQNKTPIFSKDLDHIVFRPNWGIPNSIKVKEILPKVMRGQSIAQMGYRVQYNGRDIDPYSVNWGGVDIRNYHVYQPPGERNALGLVKFMFPNKHAVYFHDTPSKYLFKKKTRAYSHGCIRVRDPMKMAAVLFAEDRGWDREKIAEIVDSGIDNNRINLNRKIPVHVAYFTARVNEDGEVVLVDDIYEHEPRIQKGFDGLTHTIVKENRSLDKYLDNAVIGRSQPRKNESNFFAFGYNEPPRNRDRSWMRNVWGNN